MTSRRSSARSSWRARRRASRRPRTSATRRCPRSRAAHSSRRAGEASSPTARTRRTPKTRSPLPSRRRVERSDPLRRTFSAPSRPTQGPAAPPSPEGNEPHPPLTRKSTWSTAPIARGFWPHPAQAESCQQLFASRCFPIGSAAGVVPSRRPISGCSTGTRGQPNAGVHMATYITLLKYTEQGLKTIKESPSRLERAKQLLKSLGGELKSFHLVQGRYDAVVISEAPNDEVVTKFALVSGSLGNVRTETLRAFTEDEYRKIVSALP